MRVSIFVRFAIFAAVVAVFYFKYRGHISDLAAASDSKRSAAFWTIAALIFAVLVALSYAVLYYVF